MLWLILVWCLVVLLSPHQHRPRRIKHRGSLITGGGRHSEPSITHYYHDEKKKQRQRHRMMLLLLLHLLLQLLVMVMAVTKRIPPRRLHSAAGVSWCNGWCRNTHQR